MMSNSAFEGKVAVVTGGARGIGFATARLLYAGGAKLVIADVDSDAAEAAADLLANGTEAGPLAIAMDVSQQDQARMMVDSARNRFGRLDILIHSAGIGREEPFLATTAETWQRMIEVDLSGTFYCCQAAAQAMIGHGGGRIVTIASVAGLRGGSSRAAYGSAKGGVVALTKVMAVELATHGITVNAIAPGAIETELVKAMHTAATRSSYLARIPMGRYGTPEEVAAAAVFLCSEQAAYITGHILAVDGGFLAAGVIKQDADAPSGDRRGD
jgi:NAD(P)-dependent dehydrogenase (short-subunit alcohol dehydrogenase family)